MQGRVCSMAFQGLSGLSDLLSRIATVPDQHGTILHCGARLIQCVAYIAMQDDCICWHGLRAAWNHH